MDFGLFNTWNALYERDTVPWHPDYQGGKLLEEDAYIKNYEEIDAVEDMGWDYIWLGGGHFSKQASMDPQVLMLAAVIAERTKHIKIGSSIHRPVMRQEGETLSAAALPHERYGFDNLLMEDPIQTAEQVSIVDQSAAGRSSMRGGRTRAPPPARSVLRIPGGHEAALDRGPLLRVRGQVLQLPRVLRVLPRHTQALPEAVSADAAPRRQPGELRANGRAGLPHRHRGRQLTAQPPRPAVLKETYRPTAKRGSTRAIPATPPPLVRCPHSGRRYEGRSDRQTEKPDGPGRRVTTPGRLCTPNASRATTATFRAPDVPTEEEVKPPRHPGGSVRQDRDCSGRTTSAPTR